MIDLKAVKKAFHPLVTLLDENRDSTVESILAEVLTLVAPKQRGATTGSSSKNHIKDTEGNVVAVLDYYFKRWMPLVGDLAVEFGAKANSVTGLNSMCKEGVSNWTTQQRAAKTAMASLLEQVEAGEIAVEDIAAERASIDEAKTAVIATDLGFDTREELEDYLVDNGISLVEED